jgi:hypothetical protein
MTDLASTVPVTVTPVTVSRSDPGAGRHRDRLSHGDHRDCDRPSLTGRLTAADRDQDIRVDSPGP